MKGAHCKLTERVRLSLTPEWLESRLLFSSYLVIGLGDAAGVVSPAGAGKFYATTLRAAINAANSVGGSDSISFAAELRGTISLKTALPHIQKGGLTLAGPGADHLTVERSSAASRPFSIFFIDPAASLSVSDLTIARGTGTGSINSSWSYADRSGGGIYNNVGTLNLVRCDFVGNGAGQGGAIYNTYDPNTFDVGKVAVRECTFSGNFSGNGGAILNTGQLQLQKTRIIDNGGSAVVNYDIGTATIADCTFSKNHGDGGGAIANSNSLTVTRCAFTDNRGGEGSGGAIYNTADSIQYPGGFLTMDRCTFTRNSAGYGGGNCLPSRVHASFGAAW